MLFYCVSVIPEALCNIKGIQKAHILSTVMLDGIYRHDQSFDFKANQSLADAQNAALSGNRPSLVKRKKKTETEIRPLV